MSTNNIKIGIIGGAGYTGGELLRLLVHHPAAVISFVHSRSNAGKSLHAVHHDLLGETQLKFTGEVSDDVDVLFLCLGHGESKKFLTENIIPANVKIIDLANDFRLTKDAVFQSVVGSEQLAVGSQQLAVGSGQSAVGSGQLAVGSGQAAVGSEQLAVGGGQLAVGSGQLAVKRSFVYGLPELNRDSIKKADNIANPGCFATAIQLGLLPLAKAGYLKDIYTTGITGSTGAGQSLSATSHFSWRANNIQAYKTLTHQHLGEIGESLLQLQPDSHIELNFVPWRGDFTRGIFISSQLSCDLSLVELNKLYEDFYADHPFTHVSREPIFLKQVVNTNKGLIQLEKAGTKLVVHSTIDNLLKGASGHAVQNMNLLFGLDETTGLQLKPAGF